MTPDSAEGKVGKGPRDDRHLFGGEMGATVIVLISHIFIYAMAASIYGYELATYAPTLRMFGVVIVYQVGVLTGFVFLHCC